MALTFRYRNNEHVRATSYRFSIVSCFGGILGYSGVFLLYPIPNDTTCALALWFFDAAFVTLFGPIFAKTYRIDKLLNTKKLKRRVISDRQVLQVFFALQFVFVVFLIVWMIVDRPYMEEAFTAAEHLRSESCKYKHSTFGLVDTILKAFVLLWGCFLCQRVYKINGQFAKYNESKQMVVCILHTSMMAAVMLVLSFATKDDPNLQFFCESAVLLESTTVVVTLLYTRVVYLAMAGKLQVSEDSDPDSAYLLGDLVRNNSRQQCINTTVGLDSELHVSNGISMPNTVHSLNSKHEGTRLVE